MVSYVRIMTTLSIIVSVLILVVVEDGLVLTQFYVHRQLVGVLILVVVEDGLVPLQIHTQNHF